VQEFTATRANSPPGEARGSREEDSCGPGQAGGSPEEPRVVAQVCEKQAATVRSPHCPQLLGG
jgi:hypothetical protein